MPYRALLLMGLVAANPAAAQSPPRALASDAVGRWEAGVGANYAWLVFGRNDEPKGWGANAYLRYGLSPTFALKASLLWSRHSLSATSDREAGTFQVVAADVGLTYALDFVRFEPKLEAGVGMLYRNFLGQGALDLGVRAGLALDYRLGRHSTVGFGIFYHGFLTDLNNLPVYVQLGPRFALQWGEAPSD